MIYFQLYLVSKTPKLGHKVSQFFHEVEILYVKNKRKRNGFFSKFLFVGR